MGKKKPHYKKKKSGVKKSRRSGPKYTDRHRLYEESVQSPGEHIKFFDRVYELVHGEPARDLKEDFCGTALLSAEWVRTRPDNTATGVDLDEPTLNWAEENNLAPLEPDQRRRVTIVRDDVRNVVEPKVDIVAALNFSYFEFKTRESLLEYFKSARKSLKPGGLLILDMFGGWEAQMEVTDKTRYSGFTYVWEQTKYNPITHLTQFHIHFKFHGGGGIDKAFEYNWRLWTIPEVKELLDEAGYGKTDVYWEGIDPDTDEGNGEFDLVTDPENCPGWIAMLVASR
ncbi:MAG: class I SAM-dependent methyltransferase [Candidatus Latescibacterota bacterium]|jgi:SAM-dependent methyltransferase